MSPKVTVIVLHYGAAEETLECLASVVQSDYLPLTCLVVDNDPQNRIQEKLLKKFPSVEYLQTLKNLGYAGGNNAGIRFALERGADYFFILNNDAALETDTISMLVAAAEQNPQVKIAAPKIYDSTDRTRINSYGTEIDWLRLRPKVDAHGQPDGPQYSANREIQIVPGSAMLIKGEFLKKSGLLNEALFLIHEDADLCFRNLKTGGKNWVVADAKAYHKQSRALAPLKESTAYYSSRNFLYLAASYAGVFDRCKVWGGLLLLLIQKSGEWLLIPNKRRAANGFLLGVRDYFSGVTGPYSGQAREEADQ